MEHDDACAAGHWPGEQEPDCPYCFPDDWDCADRGHVQGPCGLCAVCGNVGCEAKFPLDARFECGNPEEGHTARHEATFQVERDLFLTVAWHVLDTRPEVIEEAARQHAEANAAFAIQEVPDASVRRIDGRIPLPDDSQEATCPHCGGPPLREGQRCAKQDVAP